VQASHRLAGLAFVALVVSGLLVLSFAGIKPDQPIEVLRNEFPMILPPGKCTFTFSVVAKEDIRLMELRFEVLAPVDLIANDLVDPEWEQGPADGPEDVLKNVRKLSWFEEATSELGIEGETFQQTISLEGGELDLLIRDYSATIGSRLGPGLLGRNVTANVPLAFGVIMNVTEHQYFEGGMDFFVKPSVNLRNLLISHNENETRYVADEEVREGQDRLPISMVTRGIVSVESVKTDDTITVVMGAEPLQFARDLDAPAALLQVIRVYLDGEAYGEPIVNVVR
jgi:hypothetical protein